MPPPPHLPPPRVSDPASSDGSADNARAPGDTRAIGLRGSGRVPGPPVRSADSDRPSPPPAAFYDDLSAVYHLIYPDWAIARRHQGEVFAALLAAGGLAPGAAILDCAAGIGTQALGLAAAGYRVTATDASPTALRRLAEEARSLHLPVQARASDIRALAGMIRNPRDAVLAVDNAIPHLLSEHQIIVALRALATVLRPGGLLLLSMRDFDRCLDDGERPFGEGPFIHEGPPRRILYQVWDWQDERLYDAHLYITWREPANGAGPDGADGPGIWRAYHGVTRYRALRRAELARMARTAGFAQCTWQMPDESGFFQPLMIARRQ